MQHLESLHQAFNLLRSELFWNVASGTKQNIQFLPKKVGTFLL